MGRKHRKEKQRARNRGLAELSKAADRKLFDRSNDVADALMVKALEGNTASTSLLVRLAKGAEWDEIDDPGLANPTQSEQWRAESQWQGPACEEDAETRAGSREPE